MFQTPRSQDTHSVAESFENTNLISRWAMLGVEIYNRYPTDKLSLPPQSKAQSLEAQRDFTMKACEHISRTVFETLSSDQLMTLGLAGSSQEKIIARGHNKIGEMIFLALAARVSSSIFPDIDIIVSNVQSTFERRTQTVTETRLGLSQHSLRR